METKIQNPIVEICCGSYYDAMQAAAGKAPRIELNSALMLGGLTPTVATLKLIKQGAPQLKVITMVRPRGAGFCYGEEEIRVMEAECYELLQAGSDGIAFGCLSPDGSLDIEKNKRILARIKEAGKEAVFHRAFDCVTDPFSTMEQLIALGVDRVLTSGLKSKATEGMQMLKTLQKNYGESIQILAGSGINASNACQLMTETGIWQVHSSCKAWKEDPTTVKNGVSYSMIEGQHERDYDVVSAGLVEELVTAVRKATGK